MLGPQTNSNQFVSEVIFMAALRTLVAAAMFVAALTACTLKESPVPFSAAAAEASEDARKKGDYEALSSMYTDDAKLLPPNSPIIEGRPAIREFLRKLFIDEGVPLELTQREVSVVGNFAYRDGVLSQHHKDGTTEIGKFVQLWKYTDGDWKLHRVIWNMNGPDYFLPDSPAATEPAVKPKT
jgi:ketosteroid isomerase-like protein